MSLKPLPGHLEKRVKTCPIDFKRVEFLMKRARKDFSSAKFLAGEDLEGAYALLYESMLHLGLAYMAISGLYPEVKGKHKTVVDFLAYSLGQSYHEQMQFYDRMRKRRHQFIYEPGPLGCTEKEIAVAKKVVEEFLKLISEKIKETNPQKELEL